MNLRKLNDEITEEIAYGLHYLDNAERINMLRSSAAVRAAVHGGMDRYLHDPDFKARVQVLLARVMARVSAAAEQEGSK